MNIVQRLPLLVLAAPLFLSACGSGAGDEARVQQVSAARSSARAAPAPVVFAGPRSDYLLARTSGGASVTHKTTGAQVAVAADARLRFQDISVALDIGGTSGKAYRLYRAAFARTPDLLGLSYWITAMDGGASADAVAAEFTASPEFKTVYGAAPTNAQIVARFYQNVLGREGEAAGVAYWLGALDAKAVTVAQVLHGFSESAENKDAVLAAIGPGIEYNEAGVSYTPGPVIDHLPYAANTAAGNSAEATFNLNARGARGYAFVGPMTSYQQAWSMELYRKGGPGETFSYELVNAAGAAATRLASMQAQGARGYLFKSTAIYGIDVAGMADIFVKSSARNTTYSYRMQAEGFNLDSLQANGADGYAYRGQIVIDNVTQSLYVKDNTANAKYDYKTSPNALLGDGLMLATMNELGAQAYAYHGSIYTGGTFLALYVRTSASNKPYSYTIAPKFVGSLDDTLSAINEKALKGDAYYGDMMDGQNVMSVFYQGPEVVHPLLGPVFP